VKGKTVIFLTWQNLTKLPQKLTLETKRNGAGKGQISYWHYHSGKYPRTNKSCQVARKTKELSQNSQAWGTLHPQQLE
jgi:hypothetical protein